MALGLLHWNAGWDHLPGRPLATSGEKTRCPRIKGEVLPAQVQGGDSRLRRLENMFTPMVLFGRFLQWPFPLLTWMVQCHRSRRNFLGYMMKQNQELILTIPPNTFFEHLQVKKNGNFIMKYLSVFGLNFPTKLEAQAKMFFPVSAPCYKKYVTFSLTGCCGRHCHQVQTLWCWCSNTAGPSQNVRIKLLIL